MTRESDYSPDHVLLQFVADTWPPAQRAKEPLIWKPITADGSDRVFVRVRSGDRSTVLVYGHDPAENRSYELIGKHLWQIGKFGPEFFVSDQDRGLFLVEDLGDFRLQDWARATNDAGREVIYPEVVQMMANLHRLGLEGFDPDWCYQTARYDRDLVLERETDYFLSAFVQGLMHLTIKPAKFQPEFEELAGRALDGVETVLMHRDFQSRNVMIKNGRPRLVDFQGSRLGPPGYDLASLIHDPYVALGAKVKDRLIQTYLDRRSEDPDFDRGTFEKNFPYLAVCRLLQALGAYGFLSGVKGKFLFNKYIPEAVGNVDRIVRTSDFEFAPQFKKLIKELKKAVGERR